MVPIWFCIFSSFLFYKSSAEIINSLPGQPPNIIFKQHSGYIVTNSQHGRALFYYFVEADSENAASLPLTVWLNGGPGCSSVGYGAFMENGPFRPRKDGSLMKNKYSWNLESNMLYVDSPIGVGFSYSNTSSDHINWDDAATAKENLQFILKWFNKFPQYRNSDVYLTGESYAGHYIPQFAVLLLDYNRMPNVKPIKLKSIALGNPLLDIEISLKSAEYLWAHGVVSDELLDMQRTLCNETRYVLEYIHNETSSECTKVMELRTEEMGIDTVKDDILLPKCVSSSAAGQLRALGNLATVQEKFDKKVGKVADPCLTEWINLYLNKPEVQKALYANTTCLPYSWEICSGPLQYKMEDAAIDIIPVLSNILKQHIPILLFSGDQDSKLPLTQTRKIAKLLAQDLKLVALDKYGPWYDGLQIGGWSQSFGGLRKGKNVTYLTFATVRGAAHEVPYTSPSQALTLFRAFLRRYPPPRKSRVIAVQ
ncbi:serine carboxypeptidase-like 46 isoform X3 [Solanum dulcamara]|uniref:serine carboxypeptidase-like 46 isoform X3 n=1 Tax=Solanum dulcamara TaxID=45834 RepID=UPI0024867B0A|nr:serine carboxypeptidase-like 46 isoform X3 [Solanum dulcamara]